LKYNFYVILKPVDYLKTTSNIDFDKKINYSLDLNEKNKKELMLES